MTPLLIEKPSAEHLPDLLEMVEALAAHHGDRCSCTQEMLARDVLGPTPWLETRFAIQGGRALGYVALTRMAQMQYGVRGMDIHHLFVQPDVRGQGLGHRLIDTAREVAVDEGCSFLTVGTAPGNTAAQAFYGAIGFTRPQSPPGPRFRILLDPDARAGRTPT